MNNLPHCVCNWVVLLFLTSACSLGGNQTALDGGENERSEGQQGPEAEYAAYKRGVDRRLGQLVEAKTYSGGGIGKGNSDPDAGKRDWPKLLTEMYKVRNDTAALMNYINNQGRTLVFSQWAGNFCKPFTMPGLSMYYFTYKELLPEDQKQEIYDTFYTKKKECMKGNMIGWDYLMREDHLMDPIYGETEFNSENFNWMARMSGYLFAHEYNDTLRIPYFNGYIRNWIRTLYHVGRLEWNSNNYWGHCFNPLLVLYKYAPEKEVKEMAKAGLDWMVLEAGLHYLDGFQAAGDVRAKSEAYKPFAGSVWGYSYIFFATEGNEPTYLKPGFDFSKKDLKDFTAYLPYTDYYPPQVVVDIAVRNYPLPVEIQSAKPFYLVDNDNYSYWQGDHNNSRRFEFETIYQDENMLMASLAGNRPDGDFSHQLPGEREQRTFSEENLWRLSVKGHSEGAIQLFGNSGEQDDMSGRCPFEEIAQFRNIMIRAVKGTDNSWIAVPAKFTPDKEEGILFFDLGQGVYTAVFPLNPVGFTESAFKDTSYQVYKWEFDKNMIGGTVLQTGLQKDFQTFGQFKTAVLRSSSLKVSENSVVSYKSTGGDKLVLQYRQPSTFTAYTGELIDPAGVTPFAWGNGEKIHYDEWEAYKTVYGFEIVNQEWGSGILKMKSRDHRLTIKVEKENAAVNRYSQAIMTNLNAPESPGN